MDSSALAIIDSIIPQPTFQNNPSDQQPPAMTKNSSVKARSNAVIDEGKSNDVAVLTIVVIGGIDGDGDAVRVKE